MFEKIKNFLKGESAHTKILLIIILLVGIGIFANTIDSPEDVKVEETKEEPKVEEAGPGVFKDTFMKECVVAPGMEDYCECSYYYIIRNNSKADLITIAEEVDRDPNNLPPEIMDAAKHCIEDLPDSYFY